MTGGSISLALRWRGSQTSSAASLLRWNASLKVKISYLKEFVPTQEKNDISGIEVVWVKFMNNIAINYLIVNIILCYLFIIYYEWLFSVTAVEIDVVC